ncbi:MAG: hypothetical protein HOW73_38350 [Polyangiaceae bacterium]|nr:hypothetical protein [Polyangiaceae bacterium]
MRRASLALVSCALLGCPPAAQPDEPQPRNTSEAGPLVEHAAERDPRLFAVATDAVLEKVTGDAADELFPTVKRDGSLIVFQHEQAGADGAPGIRTLYGYEPGAKKRTLYTPEDRAALQPAFLPDGKGLVFVTNAPGPVSIVKTEGVAPNATFAIVVGSDLAPELSEPAVSPDGTRIAFSMRDKNGGRAVAVVGVDGSRLRVVGEGRAPAWSPRGDRLAFVRTADEYNHIFTTPLPGAANDVIAPAQQLTKGTFDCDRPTFSPKGDRIAFVSNREEGQAPRSRTSALHLFVMNTDGSAITKLTDGTARSATPQWAADGWIYFSSDRDGNFDLYRVR